MKNKTYRWMGVAAISILMAACNGEPPEPNVPAEDTTDTTTEQDPVSTTGTNAAAGGGFAVKGIEVDIDTEKLEDVLQVSYSEEDQGVEAEYDNVVTDESFTGTEAVGEMEPALRSLTLTPDSTEQEVQQQIEEAFQIDYPYERMEVEVRYPNGEEAEYEFEN